MLAPLPEAAISVGSAVPGWLRPRGSWAARRGPAGAPVAHCQTAAWAPSSGPRVWSSSPRPAAAAAACSSQTHTGSTPLSPLPVRRRGTERQRWREESEGVSVRWPGSRSPLLPRHHALGLDVVGGREDGSLKPSSQPGLCSAGHPGYRYS